MKREFGKSKTPSLQDVSPVFNANYGDITLTPEGLAYLGVLPHQPTLIQPHSPLPPMKTARLIRRAM